ncbi:MAG: hypothetical protein FJW92_08165 [Actinobacteria bacterium]|nr:hypothetical protein [Actinomycetota bacterium]
MNKLITTSAAAIVAGGLIAGGAFAGSTTVQTMPVKNLTDVATGVMYVQKAVPNAKLAGPASSYFYLSNGGGKVSISKLVTKGFDGTQMVTITPPSGSTLIQGFATISGGQLGAMVIKSTSSTPSAYKIDLGYPGEQGTLGQLTFRVQLVDR